MSMRLTFDDVQQYIRQWLKDTAGLAVDDGWLETAVVLSYLRSASLADWKVELVTIPTVVGQSVYTLEQITVGLAAKFMRPLYMLVDGLPLAEEDLEEMIQGGRFVPSMTSGVPTAHTWQTGDLMLVPAPSSASTPVIQMFYSAAPDRPVAGAALDVKFRVQWQEALAWMVLGRRYAAMPTKEQSEMTLAPQFVADQVAAATKEIRDDVWFQRTRRMRLKDRGAENDARQLSNDYYQP